MRFIFMLKSTLRHNEPLLQPH